MSPVCCVGQNVVKSSAELMDEVGGDSEVKVSPEGEVGGEKKGICAERDVGCGVKNTGRTRCCTATSDCERTGKQIDI